MFCSRCGKKVMEDMLFCPYCGAELVLPEQDSGEIDAEEKSAEKAASAAPKLERFTFDIPSEDGEAPQRAPEAEARVEPQRTLEPFPHVVRSLENPLGDDAFLDDFEDEPQNQDAQEPSGEGNADALDGYLNGGREPRKADEYTAKPGEAESFASRQRSADTLVPDRSLRSEDIFMDDISDAEDEWDAFDAFEDDFDNHRDGDRHRHAHYEDDDDDDDDDDEGDGNRSFFMRHVRGIVGFILFLALILLLVFYFLSDAGQTSLARINATLPIVKSDIYAGLGRQYYEEGNYAQAGLYYERALAREPGSFNWASSAAMAYEKQGDIEKETDMLVKCIGIDPNAPEPYYYLLDLYPNASSRPADVAELLRQGYQITGDSRLDA